MAKREDTELVNCIIALCKSNKNIYLSTISDLKKNKQLTPLYKRLSEKVKTIREVQPELFSSLTNKDRKPEGRNLYKLKEFDVVFGYSSRTADTHILGRTTKSNESTMRELALYSQLYRETYLELYPDSEFKYLSPILYEDCKPLEFDSTIDLEKHIYQVGAKLGFVKRSASTDKVILDNGEIVPDKEAIRIEIDDIKYTANKAGCGVNLSTEVAHKLLDDYKGVYAIYLPMINADDYERKGFFKCALRISHTLDKVSARCSVVRVKLNMPWIGRSENEKLRHQYRGYLSPAGDEHLNITCHHVTNTINRERIPSAMGEMKSDVVNLIFQQKKDSDWILEGIFSSLCQKIIKQTHPARLPYASKVLVIKEFVPEYERDEYESRFMEGAGIGYYGDLSALLSSITDKKYKEEVDKYFSKETTSLFCK